MDVLATYLNRADMAYDLRQAQAQLVAAEADDSSARLSVKTIPRENGGYRQLRHRLNEDDERSLVEAFNSGTSRDDLAKRYGISRSGVGKLLRANGAKPHRKFLNEDQIDHAKQLYQSGLSTAKVAEKLGFSQPAIWRALDRVGVMMRDHRRERDPES